MISRGNTDDNSSPLQITLNATKRREWEQKFHTDDSDQGYAHAFLTSVSSLRASSRFPPFEAETAASAGRLDPSSPQCNAPEDSISNDNGRRIQQGTLRVMKMFE